MRRARLKLVQCQAVAAPQLFGKEQDIRLPRQFKQRVGVVTNRNRIKVTRTAVLLFSFPWESDILAPDFLIFFGRCPSETPLCTKKSAPSADLYIDRPFLNCRFYSGSPADCLAASDQAGAPTRVKSEDVIGLLNTLRAEAVGTFRLIHCHHLRIFCCLIAYFSEWLGHVS